VGLYLRIISVSIEIYDKEELEKPVKKAFSVCPTSNRGNVLKWDIFSDAAK